jgi:hypothetical protein
MLVGQRPASAQEVFRTLQDAAFAEDWLEHYGAGVGVDGSLQRFDVVLCDEGHVFEQGLETFAIFVLASQGHGAKRPAMVRTLQRHELRFGLASCLVAGETRQFDGAFHRFGAAVRKENPVEA